ncbi:MAG: hypothetical protein IKH31_03575 [Clostridia bacterium]|nr:hypothetical protein [Clostridia bacterium]
MNEIAFAELFDEKCANTGSIRAAHHRRRMLTLRIAAAAAALLFLLGAGMIVRNMLVKPRWTSVGGGKLPDSSGFAIVTPADEKAGYRTVAYSTLVPGTTEQWYATIYNIY